MTMQGSRLSEYIYNSVYNMGPVQSENDMRDRIGYTECVIHVFILYTCSIQIQNCPQITEAQVEKHTQNFYCPKN